MKHITVELEEALREEIRDMRSLPLLGATSSEQYEYQRGWLAALEHVLDQATTRGSAIRADGNG